MGKKRRSPARIATLLFASILFAALLLEGVVRARHWLQHGSVERMHTFEWDEASGLMIPSPGRETKRIRIDSRGFRNPELDVPKPEGVVRIAFLGASTTFCAEVENNESTWPHRVWTRLVEAYPEAGVDYVNAGVGGYPIQYSRMNLEKRVAPLEPDIIVIYHAVNDISKDTRELARLQGVYTEHADSDSWLSRYSMAWYLIEKNLILRRRQEEAAAAQGRLDFDPATVADGFRDRLRDFVREAEKVADVVALVTFSHHVREDQSEAEKLRACNTALYYMPYMTPDGILAAFDAYNRAIREVARETGVLLIEGEDEIPGDPDHFNDSVHFKDLGCERMAERMAERLIGAEAIEAVMR